MRSGRRPKSFSCLALTCLLLTASPCLADPAAQLYEQGRALFLEGFFERAIDRLEEARQRAKDARQLGAIWLYLGLCHDGLGEADRAKQSFVTALTHDPTLELGAEQFKPAVVEQLTRIKAGMRGLLRVSAQQGVRVLVDGKLVSTPFEERVPVGRHRVEARSLDGQLLLDRKVIVHAEKRSEVELFLPQKLLPQEAAPPPRRRPGLVWAWVAGGAAVAGAAVALGLELGIRSNQGEAEGLPRGGLDDRELQQLDELAASSDRMRLGATISWSIAGACAVGSVILFLTSWSRRVSGRPPVAGRLSIVGWPLGAHLLSLRLRF